MKDSLGMAEEDAPHPVKAVLAALELTPAPAEDEFVGTSLPQLHGRVYGGQVLAQALVAAGRTVAQTRLVHSMHGYFLRPGQLETPITFAVERLRDGGSFSARRTHALQDGLPILSMIASFQEPQAGIEHAETMPPVPGPDEVPSAVDFFRSVDHPVAQFFYRTGAFDIRHVEGALWVGPGPDPVPRQHLWIRAREPVASTDQSLQRALLAYACDQTMLEPVLRRHQLSWRTPGTSIASLDHAMWWFRDVDVNEWMLFSQDSPAAQGGRGLGTALVWNLAGELVASIAQEGMVRVRS